MKILRKIITLNLVTLIIFKLITTNNTLASSSLNFNSGGIANVAVIIHRIDDPYMIRFREGLENIEKERKNNIKFTFFYAENNISIQNEILDSALRNSFDLIILNLADKTESIVEDVIMKVKQKDIPLILIKITPEVVSKVYKLYNRVAFISSDTKQASIKQGEIVIELWNSNEKVIDKNHDDILQYVLLQGQVSDPEAIDRTKYVISTINESGIKTQQLELIHGGWLKELGKSYLDNLFLKYNGKIEAIISNNDAMAIGAIEALQKYGYNKGDKTKNIAVIGFDGLPEAIDFIDKGFMTGTVIQDPNVAAETFYKVGMNLINNLNPTEKTNYKIVDGAIIIPFPYNVYTGKLKNT